MPDFNTFLAAQLADELRSLTEAEEKLLADTDKRYQAEREGVFAAFDGLRAKAQQRYGLREPEQGVADVIQ